MLTAQKNNLNIFSIIESAGVDLKQAGTRHVGLCPFHAEKTPSFFVFDGNRFKCFGCGESGDVLDFVQKHYGLSFLDSLKHLGIEQGKQSKKEKAEIERRKIEGEKAKAKKKFRADLQNTLLILVNATKKAIKNFKTTEDLDKYGDILQPLPYWEHYLDVLAFGTKEDQKQVCEQFRNMPVLSVKRFFKPEFNLNKVIDKIFEKRDADEWTITLHVAGRETSCAEAFASG